MHMLNGFRRVLGQRQSRFQFRLRTMIVVNVVVAMILFGFYAYFISPIRSELRIKRLVEHAGGQVGRVDNHPAWLKRVLQGQDQRRVVIVHLEGADITDSDILLLRELPKLGGLYLNRTAITDAALPIIDSMTKIQYMNLNDTKITSARLAGLSKLQDLYLSGAPVASVRLHGLASLKLLDLSKTKIDDADMADLISVPTLESLNLCDTVITDLSLAQLEAMPKLRTLYLHGTQVTPEGIARLKLARPRISVHHFR